MSSCRLSLIPLGMLTLTGLLLAATAPPARAQYAYPDAAPPGQPRQPQQPQQPQAPPAAPEQAAPQQQAQEPSFGQAQAAATGAGNVAVASANVQGDQLGIPALGVLPASLRRPGQPVGVAVPAVRSFKIAEDQNPAPQDRAYVDFNYYNNVNRTVNERLASDFFHIQAYRETFGLEKTFWDGGASIGLRLPLNTLSADSDLPGFGGTHTDVGDLSVISKFVFWRDQPSGSLVSGGLAVTAPTGPSSFAGANVFVPVHDWLLTPYVGYLCMQDRWYLQGFTSLDVPTGRDVTLLHNDVQLGYFLSRNRDEGAWLTAVIPVFEVHVNDPLNHRGATNPNDPLGTPDWVDLTAGVTFELKGCSTLAVGFVTPVTGPKPYDFEVLVQLNIFFGRSRRGAAGAAMAANVQGGF